MAFEKMEFMLSENELNQHFVVTYRSSHRRGSVKKGVLRNFAKFTGKQLYQGRMR